MNLPINLFSKKIQDTVAGNGVTIISAQTGAGKSTQVPQMLWAPGKKIVVTQPRRLAAKTVAKRVAEEMSVQFGHLVGYKTGEEGLCNSSTEILFCTDGLQLVRELTAARSVDVLILDEVHEWNINIETLVAWVKLQEWKTRVVLMSATLEAEKVSAYFNGAPIIEVPGRAFPVEVHEEEASALLPTIKECIEAGRNTLVFQPGVREIEDTVADVKRLGVPVECLPLHGRLEGGEQQKCFRSYKVPKVVVATNVAQTSITIPDIDAVVDSGMMKRVELVEGVEGLYLKDISQADCLQRKGRAGRTKAGVYYLCARTTLDDRPEFPKAAIERAPLDQLTLRLAMAGFDIAALRFFHQPDREAIKAAKEKLVLLGAMTHSGRVTAVGKRMARLPLATSNSRMVVEAIKRGVVTDVVTIAAILETGSLRSRQGGWKELTKEESSDLLVELDLFEYATTHPSEMMEKGIFKKAFYKAKELRRKILSSLSCQKTSSGNREDIKHSCVVGMLDTFAVRSPYGTYNGREIDKQSVLWRPDYAVGRPFDLEISVRRGTRTLNLLTMATELSLEEIKKYYPQLVETREGTAQSYHEREDVYKRVVITSIGGTEVERKEVLCDPPAENYGFVRVISFDIACSGHNKEVSDLCRRLHSLGIEGVPNFDSPSYRREWVEEQLQGIFYKKDIPEGALLFPAVSVPEVTLRINDTEEVPVDLLEGTVTLSWEQVLSVTSHIRECKVKVNGHTYPSYTDARLAAERGALPKEVTKENVYTLGQRVRIEGTTYCRDLRCSRGILSFRMAWGSSVDDPARNAILIEEHFGIPYDYSKACKWDMQELRKLIEGIGDFPKHVALYKQLGAKKRLQDVLLSVKELEDLLKGIALLKDHPEDGVLEEAILDRDIPKITRRGAWLSPSKEEAVFLEAAEKMLEDMEDWDDCGRQFDKAYSTLWEAVQEREFHRLGFLMEQLIQAIPDEDGGEDEDAGATTFIYTGDRYFRCTACDDEIRVDRSVYRSVNNGLTLWETCPSCGRRGMLNIC